MLPPAELEAHAFVHPDELADHLPALQALRALAALLARCHQQTVYLENGSSCVRSRPTSSRPCWPTSPTTRVMPAARPRPAGWPPPRRIARSACVASWGCRSCLAPGEAFWVDPYTEELRIESVTRHIDPDTDDDPHVTLQLSLIFNLVLPGRARLCSSFGVSARQGAATA